MSVPPVFTFSCAMLYGMSYVYYKVLETQICCIEAEYNL